MKRLSDRGIWGLVLVVLGAAFLLRNLGLWGGLDEFVFGGLFAAGGLVFLATYLGAPKSRWWSIIPGCVLLGLGALIALSGIPGRLDALIGAPIFLGMISLAFMMVFFTDARRWWALIPGGTMATVALVAWLDALHAPIDSGAVVLFGLAATFGLVSLVKAPQGRLRWALIPAGVLAGIGLLVLSESVGAVSWIWPLVIVLAGVVLVLRSARAREQREE